jgi:hypothetical protein
VISELFDGRRIDSRDFDGWGFSGDVGDLDVAGEQRPQAIGNGELLERHREFGDVGDVNTEVFDGDTADGGVDLAPFELCVEAFGDAWEDDFLGGMSSAIGHGDASPEREEDEEETCDGDFHLHDALVCLSN